MPAPLKCLILLLVALLLIACSEDERTEQCMEADPVGQPCEHDTDCRPVVCHCEEQNWQASQACIDGVCEGAEENCPPTCIDEGGWTGDCE